MQEVYRIPSDDRRRDAIGRVYRKPKTWYNVVT